MATPRSLNSFEFIASLVLSLLACTAPVFAQNITCTFIAPSAPVTAGTRQTLWLFCMNGCSNEAPQVFQASLNAQLISQSGSSKAILKLNSPDGQNEQRVIPPGKFVEEEYFLDVPPDLHGQVVLDISNYNQIVLQINHPPSSEASSPAPMPDIGKEPTAAKRSALVSFFENRVSFYEPIYFLLGTYPAAEFQFSLKSQLFNFTNSFSLLTNLYFAYTQTSYWDLISKDPSFYDTSYKPSVFIFHPDVYSTREKTFQLDLQGGLEHESNGRGGTMERSLYTAYVQPTLTFGKPGQLQLTLQPRAWTYFWVGDNNPDIAEFRGYTDLVSALTLKKTPDSWANFQVASRFRIGDEGSHAGIQIDLRYKIPHFSPAIQLQYFTGYGQTLRQYNVESHGFRAGLCLWYWPDYPLSHASK